MKPHNWKPNGITIDTRIPFKEKICTVCGAINWGGREDGDCPGDKTKPLQGESRRST